MSRSFGLFERFGVELEYMIVDERTLAIRPAADQLFRRPSGRIDGDVVRGRFAWSNELALHVIELKTEKPAVRLAGLAEGFQREVRHVNALLAGSGARLLPTAMHPWMNPARESRLWPHSNGPIYAAFDRIFNCSGHGWTNLQSAHLNLSFRTGAEFRRLHAAIRVLLPLLPALAASSPFVEGRRASWLDTRLAAYRQNCRRLASITGRVVPERVRSPTEYRTKILHRIYRDLAPHDPEGILRHEWANARGAIARFDRNTIEIRVVDLQECPAADLALAQFAVAILRGLISGELSDEETQGRPSTAALERVLVRCAEAGRGASVEEPAVVRAFGIRSRHAMSAGELLRDVLDAVAPRRASWRANIEYILEAGTLAERILKAVSAARPSRAVLRRAYARLADCLQQGKLFQV